MWLRLRGGWRGAALHFGHGSGCTSSRLDQSIDPQTPLTTYHAIVAKPAVLAVQVSMPLEQILARSGMIILNFL